MFNFLKFLGLRVIVKIKYSLYLFRALTNWLRTIVSWKFNDMRKVRRRARGNLDNNNFDFRIYRLENFYNWENLGLRWNLVRDQFSGGRWSMCCLVFICAGIWKVSKILTRGRRKWETGFADRRKTKGRQRWSEKAARDNCIRDTNYILCDL